MERFQSRQRCTTCQRITTRPAPNVACTRHNCHGTTVAEKPDQEDYDVWLMGRPFVMVSAEEHTAQVPGEVRNRIENDFKSGAVNPRDLKARLAREIITRLRGATAADAAEAHFDKVFRRHEAADDLQELALEPADLEDGSVFLPKVMERWFGQTRSEWRRRIQQGGVSLDGEPLASLTISAAQLSGRRLRAGKSARFQGVVRRG